MAADPVLVALIGLVAVMLGATLALLYSIRRRLDADPDDADQDLDPEQLELAMRRTFEDLDVEGTIADVERHAAEMADLHDDIETMLRHPQRRGEFGEVQLDVILEDHLPPEMYGIREQAVDGKTPDAQIETTAGVVAIDSKFPLDNYVAASEADDEHDRERALQDFADDVEGHLEKIASDYVRPEAGTTDFAFAFIPSEGVYYHLVTEQRDLLREYTREGVQVVSPLTLGHKLELIRADVHARKLTAEAEAVREDLDRLGTAFADLQDVWETFFETHLQHAYQRAQDVDSQYQQLREAFRRIDAPTTDPDGAARAERDATRIGQDGPVRPGPDIPDGDQSGD